MSKTLIFISVVWYNDGYNLYFCDYWVRKKIEGYRYAIGQTPKRIIA